MLTAWRSGYEEVRMEPWFIKDTGISQRLSEEDLIQIHNVCPRRTYRLGEAIYRAGDEADALHILLAGQVKLVSPTAAGQDRILAICGPQDFFGDAFLSQEPYYRVDAVALSEVVETCPISREQYLQLMQRVPNFILTFTDILTQHLFHCRNQLVLVNSPVKERLIGVLIEQAQRYGHSEEVGWVELETKLTHDELASLISATRVSVTTSMTELRRRGLLEGTRGMYRLNVLALAALVEV